MFKQFNKALFVGVLAASIGLSGCGGSGEQTVNLKASHQWPGGKGDMRDVMVQMIAEDAKAANVGLNIQVYPGKSLFKPKEQWGAMVDGNLDMTAFPLAYAGGRHPELNLTLMPGLVKNHDHAMRLSKSPFMDRIKKIMDDAGVIVLADTWMAGGFVSKKNCIGGPDSVKGQQFRAAGKAFNEMLTAAGASIASMPSSEIYSGLQTGVLDGANTSSASLVSYRIYEQVKCLTAPGKTALWFMYEPILMSKAKFNSLSKPQQDALIAAGKKAEEYAFAEAKNMDAKLVEAYKAAGVEVVEMTQDEFNAWREIAKTSSYKNFAEKVEGGSELLDMALAVE